MVIPTPIGEFGQFGSGSTERADFGGDFVGFAIAVLISANQNVMMNIDADCAIEKCLLGELLKYPRNEL